jgi:hypothetical protein
MIGACHSPNRTQAAAHTSEDAARISGDTPLGVVAAEAEVEAEAVAVGWEGERGLPPSAPPRDTARYSSSGERYVGSENLNTICINMYPYGIAIKTREYIDAFFLLPHLVRDGTIYHTRCSSTQSYTVSALRPLWIGRCLKG